MALPSAMYPSCGTGEEICNQSRLRVLVQRYFPRLFKEQLNRESLFHRSYHGRVIIQRFCTFDNAWTSLDGFGSSQGTGTDAYSSISQDIIFFIQQQKNKIKNKTTTHQSKNFRVIIISVGLILFVLFQILFLSFSFVSKFAFPFLSHQVYNLPMLSKSVGLLFLAHFSFSYMLLLFFFFQGLWDYKENAVQFLLLEKNTSEFPTGVEPGHNYNTCQGRSQPSFPFKSGKAFSQNVRAERPQKSLWPKATSFLGVGGGEGSWGMPQQKIAAF